jgi:hypothetical protein
MKLIAVATENEDQAQFVYTALQEARAKGRVRLDDVALASRDTGGHVNVSHTKGRVSRMFGSGIDEKDVRQVLATAPGPVYVFALGAEENVDAVTRRVNTVTRGSMKTYDVEGGTLTRTTEQDATFALSGETAALLEDSEAIEQPETLLPKGIFS